LWKKAFTKAKASYQIISAHYSYNDKVYSSGFKFKRNLNYLKEHEEILVDIEEIEIANKESQKNSCIIHPSNTYKKFWDLVVVILLLYTAFWTPYNICFAKVTSDFQFFLDTIVDSLFLTDIVITFNTAIVDL